MSRITVRKCKVLPLAIGLLSVGLLPATASAKMDCHASYEAAMTTVNSKPLSPDHREAAFRIAHHAYDLCTIGDEDQAKRIFEKLNANSN